MGRECGYLGLASSIAVGAEMELLPEDNVTLESLVQDVYRLRKASTKARNWCRHHI